MAIDLTGALAGAAVGSVAGDIYGTVKEQAREATNQNTPQHSPFIEDQLLVELVGLIAQAAHETRAAAKACPPKFEPLQVPTSESAGTNLIREGYKHVSILIPAGGLTISVRFPIIGNIVSFNLSAGWNAFDMPDHSVLWQGGAAPVNVMVYKGDDSLDIPGV